jgi:excisionase family DNA binding protein
MILDVDAWEAAHLAAAIRAHRDAMRRERHPVPDVLEAIEQRLVARVRTARANGGQARPTGDGIPGVPDPDRMTLLLTFQQAAEALAVSVRTVRRLVAAGHLSVREVASCRRIHRDDVEAFAAGNR